MKRSRFTESQGACNPEGSVCWSAGERGVAQAREQFGDVLHLRTGGLEISNAKQLKGLESENNRGLPPCERAASPTTMVACEL